MIIGFRLRCPFALQVPNLSPFASRTLLRYWSGAIDWTTVNHCLQKFVIHIVRFGIRGPRDRAVVGKPRADRSIQEIGARHKLRQISKAGRIIGPQLAYDRRGVPAFGRLQPLFQTRFLVRTNRQCLIQALPGYASLAPGEKPRACRDENISETGQNGSFCFIKDHAGTAW